MAASAQPTVSIVVTATNDENAIRDCLASLMNVRYPEERREIVVVVAGSTDRTHQIVDEFPARCLMAAKRGVASARNRGIAASEGDIVAFTDPDCVASTGWLEELVGAFGENGSGAVAGAIVPYPPRTTAERYAARRMSHSQLRPLADPQRPFAMTPNLALRRELLERVGCFDSRFPGGGFEDADLCWRVRMETGLVPGYAPRAVVFHRYRTTARDFLVQHYRYGYGLALLRRKYPDELDWGLRRRAAGYARLGGSAARLVSATARRADVGLAGFDLMRHAGQRAGFLWGSLTGVRFENG